MRIRLVRCPNCHQHLQVSELTCPSCDLQLRGRFERGCKFCALDAEQTQLLDVFLSCRGVVRDMEKALGVSYPTVRARVDALLAALGYGAPRPESKEDLATRRQEILDQLESGELTAEEAAAALKELR